MWLCASAWESIYHQWEKPLDDAELQGEESHLIPGFCLRTGCAQGAGGGERYPGHPVLTGRFLCHPFFPETGFLSQQMGISV